MDVGAGTSQCSLNGNYNSENQTHNLTTSVSILLLPADGDDIMLLLPSLPYLESTPAKCLSPCL